MTSEIPDISINYIKGFMKPTSGVSELQPNCLIPSPWILLKNFNLTKANFPLPSRETPNITPYPLFDLLPPISDNPDLL